VTPRRGAGFTLVELIVALVALAILLSMVVSVAGQVAGHTRDLAARSQASGEAARLRRILHRDLAMADPATLALTGYGFVCSTSHNMFLGLPLPSSVEWDFSEGMVRRVEQCMGPSVLRRLTLMEGLTSWGLDILDRRSGRWLAAQGIQTATLLLPGALRLTLTFAERSVEMTEALPPGAAQ
jgi:prepilin-type N-terminal cleavage/methylation domain-containing protein